MTTEDRAMTGFTKNQVATMVRQAIRDETKLSVKTMHLNVHLFKFDQNDRSLKLDVVNLEHILLDLENDLNITFDLNGDWGDPKQFVGTVIEYNAHTRLHHLIDYVYETYVSTKNKELVKSKNKDDEKEQGEEKPAEPMEKEPVSANTDPDLPDESYYMIVVNKNDTRLHVACNQEKLSWMIHSQNAALFNKDYINSLCDVGSDDVIESFTRDCSLKTLLVNLTPPFEVIFYTVKAVDSDAWVYTDEDKVNTILEKLSAEDAAFIRKNLK